MRFGVAGSFKVERSCVSELPDRSRLNDRGCTWFEGKTRIARLWHHQDRCTSLSKVHHSGRNTQSSLQQRLETGARVATILDSRPELGTRRWRTVAEEGLQLKYTPAVAERLRRCYAEWREHSREGAFTVAGSGGLAPTRGGVPPRTRHRRPAATPRSRKMACLWFELLQWFVDEVYVPVYVRIESKSCPPIDGVPHATIVSALFTTTFVLLLRLHRYMLHICSVTHSSVGLRLPPLLLLLLRLRCTYVSTLHESYRAKSIYVSKVESLRCRSDSALVLKQARLIRDRLLEQGHPAVSLPKINKGFLRRWRLEFGLHIRTTTVRFKACAVPAHRRHFLVVMARSTHVRTYVRA